MSAVAGASIKFTILADGTPRATFDFDPKDSDACFAMFGKPGQSVAVAALKAGYGAKSPEEPPKLGPLAMLAVRWCKSPEFWNWLESPVGKPVNEEGAKAVICFTCHITSRKELDANPDASSRFEKHFRKPFSKHLKDSGIEI